MAETPRKRPQPAKTLEVTRQLPLTFAKTANRSHKKQQPHLHTCRWRSFYLPLCPLQLQEIFCSRRILFAPQDHQWRLDAVPRPSQLWAQQVHLCGRHSLATMEHQG